MTAAQDRFPNTDTKNAEQGHDKAVSWNAPSQAGFTNAAQIHHRYQSEHTETGCEGVLLQSRHGRLKRADAGGNGDGDIEKVIQKQRRGGNQTGGLSEILLGYCVRTAAVRIGGQRLAIRKMQNRQQNQNCDDNFADVGKPDNPEGREYRKRRFRTIGGRAKGIQTKNRNAAERADPLLFSFRSFQRSAEKDSENR